MRASSKLKRLGSPSPPLAKFITLITIGACAPIELLLAAEVAHPGAAPLLGPGEIVADEQRDRRAVTAGDRPSARVWVMQRQVEPFGEAQPEQPPRRVEGGVDHAVELEVGLCRALVEIVLRLAAFLGEVAPVPRRDAEIAALAGDDGLQRLGFPATGGGGGRPDRFQEVERGARRLGHRIGEAVVGVAFVAEQFGALGPQAHHFCGDRPVVGRAAVLAARAPCAEGGLAQIPAGRELQERLDARSRERDDVAAGMAALGREPRGACDQEARKPVEVALVEPHSPGPFVRQHVLAEGGRQRGEPFADRGEARLGFRREPGAGAGEVEVSARKRARLLGREPERRLVRVQGVDPPEQRVVQIGVARVAREDRGDGALDRLEFVVRLGAGEIEEQLGDPVERPPAPLHGLDRVGEGRGRGIGGDGVDLGPRFLQGRLEGRLEAARRDAVEGRRLERAGPGFEERVGVRMRKGHRIAFAVNRGF